jgi:CheY-like chemotaxis protein
MNAPAHSSRASRVRNALLVDDDKFMLVVVSDMLQDLGVTGIVTATNGSAAIEAHERALRNPIWCFAT